LLKADNIERASLLNKVSLLGYNARENKDGMHVGRKIKMTEKKFNPDKAHILMSEDRKNLLQPDNLLEHLNVQKYDVIADLGAGTGFFTIPAAKRTQEKVYAVDIEPKMLGLLKENANKENIENIHYVESDLDQIKLADKSVNKVIISHVMHEVPSVDRTINEIKRILQQEGQMLVVEWEAIETESGPPHHIRIPSTEMKDILEKAGFDAEIIPIKQANYAVKAVLN